METYAGQNAGGPRNRWLIPLGIVIMLIGAAAVLPSPYVLERPGPVVNALGSITVNNEEFPVVEIAGVETFEATGAMNILSVTLRGNPENRLSWLAALPGWIDPTQQLVPIEKVFPENVGSEDVEKRNVALMKSSQLQSTAAAANLLEVPVETRLIVSVVTENSAAEGVLELGDEIRSVDGVVMTSVTKIREYVGTVEPGRPVEIEIERSGEIQNVSIVPQRSTTDSQPLLGIQAVTEIEFPFDVDIEIDRIGGPSAGLTFAIAQYELLSQEDLLSGNNISATGTINVDGLVGPIGGLTQKIWGASRAGSDLVLFPVQNCADVPSKLPSGMKVAPVHSLEEAVHVLRAYRDGNKIPGLEACQ